MNGTHDTLHLFLSGFSARDLAEPLLSFDDTASPVAIHTAVQDQDIEIIGVRRAGGIAGWLHRDDVANGAAPLTVRPFDPVTVIADTASLNEVVRGLMVTPEPATNAARPKTDQVQPATRPCLFVRTFGHVSGLIRLSDLEKPAMRMWLFGLVTIMEQRITRLIDTHCPEGAWQQYMSEGRLHKAAELQAQRRRRGQSPGLLDCLQFGDKAQIVARDDALRQLTQFTSRRAVDDFASELQDLRNNLAHSQDISDNWSIICDLTINLHRVVLGPAAAAEHD